MTEITDTQREDERVMVMAVYISHHSIGVACHDERLNIIYVDSQYFVLDESEDILQHIKFSMMPTFLLLHPTMITNDALLQLLRKGYDESSDDIPYQVLKSSTWNESTCWNLIQTNLKIAQGPNAYQQLATCTDIENKTIIPAIGALISYLQTTSDHNIPNGIVRINKLLQIPLNEYLRIDLNSLQALQIFAEDVHPNMLKGTGKSKEGYSIFALMDRTKSLPGREKLRTWMSRPLANISSISERHRGVEFAINNSNSDLVSTLSSQMRHVHDIARLILRIKKVVAKAEDWCKVHTTLTAMIAIHVAISCFLRTSTQDVDFLNELMTGISVEALIEVNLSLSDWIDFDQTSKENVVTILHGRDPLLDRKRELYEDLEGYLVQAAQQILQDTPELHVSIE